MKSSSLLIRQVKWSIPRPQIRLRDSPYVRQAHPRRLAHTPAEDPNFLSIVDNPPTPVKSGKQHGPGLIILGGIEHLILFLG